MARAKNTAKTMAGIGSKLLAVGVLSQEDHIGSERRHQMKAASLGQKLILESSVVIIRF
jgi:hypothetical protein